MTPARQKALTLGNIATIETMTELRAFWAELNKVQPDMARDAEVQAAKDERKRKLWRGDAT